MASRVRTSAKSSAKLLQTRLDSVIFLMCSRSKRSLLTNGNALPRDCSLLVSRLSCSSVAHAFQLSNTYRQFRRIIVTRFSRIRTLNHKHRYKISPHLRLPLRLTRSTLHCRYMPSTREAARFLIWLKSALGNRKPTR